MFGSRVTIRNKPNMYNELLVVGNFVSLPKACADKLKVGVCDRQEYIRNLGKVFIFTPFEDVR
jgi:hypothetical protein